MGKQGCCFPEMDQDSREVERGAARRKCRDRWCWDEARFAVAHMPKFARVALGMIFWQSNQTNRG